MKIKKLNIQNFRGIKSLEVDLTVPGTDKPLDLAVFAGPNGCGKTALLEACIICLDRTDLMADQRVHNKHNVQSGTQGFHIKADIADGTATRSVEINSNTTGSYQLSARMKCERVAYFSSWRWPKLIGPVMITAGKRGKRPAKSEDNRLWRIKNYFVNLKARRAFTDVTEAPLPVSHIEEAAWGRLTAAWQQFYPDSQDRFEALVASEEVEEGFELFCRRNRGAISIPVESLSSGEIEVLTFIGSFIIEDFAGGLVLIDEPELHLHPAWHRAMLRAMRFLLPDVQILCATHSAEVLDCVASYERFVLLDDTDPRVRLVRLKS